MIVTAYTDIQALTGGINDGQISRYISKPWREEEMVATLQMAIDAYHLGTFTKELQVRLLKWEQLSTSSFVVGHLLHDLCNPAAALHDNLAFTVSRLPGIQAALQDAPGAAGDVRRHRRSDRRRRHGGADHGGTDQSFSTRGDRDHPQL